MKDRASAPEVSPVNPHEPVANDEDRPLLSVRDVSIAFRGPVGWNTVVESVSFDIHRGQAVGLVGESGSGKTVTALASVGLVPNLGGRVKDGSVVFEGQELTRLARSRLDRIRGDRIGVIFQQPTRSLDPAFTVGHQIAETVRRHRGGSRRDAWRRAIDMLERVGIPDPARRAKQYPHSFSGGMCQRAMIAMALACDPALLIADEPTTALDVRVQARILSLIAELQRDLGIAVLFISHDLAVVAKVCDRINVMYAGQIVEEQPTNDLLLRPRHPYTAGLLASVPSTTSRHLSSIRGSMPSVDRLPQGCRFHPRCDAVVVGRCDVGDPPLVTGGAARVRCLRADELSLSGVET